MAEATMNATTTDAPPDALLTPEDVAGLYKIGRRTVYEWTEKDLIPRPVITRHRFTRWRASDVYRHIRDMGQKQREEEAS